MENREKLQQRQAERRQRQLQEVKSYREPLNWQRVLNDMKQPRYVLRVAIFLVVVLALIIIASNVSGHLQAQLTAEIPTSNAQFIRADEQSLSLDNLENTLIGFYLRLRQSELDRPVDEQATGRVPFTISPGEPASLVADRLQQAGFIADVSLFRLFMRYNNIDQSLEAGDFEISPAMTMTEIAQALQKARFSEVAVTIPEGLRAEEIADLLDKQNIMDSAAFLAAVRTSDLKLLGIEKTYSFLATRPAGASLEGYLYPDTYRLPAKAKPADLIERMLDNFAAKISADTLARAQQRGLSVHQLLTLASIVERETPRADERPMVASVYLNRVAKQMLLNADPTVQYAMGYQPATGQWWKTPVLLEEYQSVQSPYNTYLNVGLPPGPICNAGLSAIEAVANPAETDYIYFVATGDGGHAFAVTAEQHAANVKAYENR